MNSSWDSVASERDTRDLYVYARSVLYLILCLYHTTISPPEGETRFVFTQTLSACASSLISACAMTEWKSIALVSKEINLELTLCSGQAFRWGRGEEGEWRGAIGEK